MRTLAEPEFLRWCAGRGISLDPKYPRAAVLSFLKGASDARFWCVPAEPQRRPYFLASLLQLMGDWTSCFAWRHSGSWPDIGRIDPQRTNDVVEYRILKGLGLPVGTAEVVEFPRAESDILLTLLFSTTIFAWSVSEDVYVVPDHARYIVQTDHHDVIHVEFRDAGDVGSWVAGMAERGFALPDDVPDASFK